MSLNTEIETQLETIVKGISNVQEVCDRNSQRIDALDQEQVQKINSDVTKNIDEVNAIKAKAEKLESDIKNMEKSLSRPYNGKEQDVTKAKSEFLKYLRKGVVPTHEVQEEIAEFYAKKVCLGGDSESIKIAKKSLVEGNNPDGGYWIRPEISDMTIDRIFETSPMRGLANIMTIAGESVQLIIDDNEADADWVGEVDARPETNTPRIGEKEIFAHEMYANPAISQRLLDDAGFDVENWLQTKVSDRFARLENTAFVVGDSSKKPRGFLDYPAWADVDVYERAALAQLDSGANGSFSADNLITLQNKLLEFYQGNATWVMKRDTFTDVMTLKDSENQYLLNPSIIAQGATKVLLGRPVVFFDDMPEVATDALAIAYGDFSVGYTIVDRIGIRVLRDPYTNKPFVRYYTTKRTGGDVTNYQAIKILKLSA